MNIIEAHINYEIEDRIIFDNININITKGAFVSIIGENGVGKTTLLKLLGGLLITNNNIKVDNMQINKYNIEEVNKRVSYITSFNEFFSHNSLLWMGMGGRRDNEKRTSSTPQWILDQKKKSYHNPPYHKFHPRMSLL